MATAPLTLSIKINAQVAAATQAISNFTAKVKQAAQVQQLPNIGGAASAGVGAATASLAGFITTALAAAAAVASISAAFKSGLDGNKAAEEANLGLAAIIASTYEIKEANGELAEGPRKLAIAIELAKEQMTALGREVQDTTLSAADLQEAIGGALTAGSGADMGLGEIRIAITGLAQASDALGMSAAQAGAEFSKMVAGEESDLAKKLGIPKEDLASWKEAGTLAENLNKKVQSYRDYGAEAGKTWAGTFGSISSGIGNALQDATGPAFENIKKAGQDALSSLFQDGALKAEFQGLASAAEGVFTFIGEMVSTVMGGAVAVAAEFSGWIERNEEPLLRIKETLTYAWDSLVGMVKSVASLFKGLESSVGIADVFSGLIKMVVLSVSAIADGFKGLGVLALSVGILITDYVVKPLKDVINYFSTIASRVPGLGAVSRALKDMANGINTATTDTKAVRDKWKDDLENNSNVQQALLNFKKTGAELKVQREEKKLLDKEIADKKAALNKGAAVAIKAMPVDDGSAKKAADAYAAALRVYTEAEIAAAKRASDAVREVAGAELEAALASRLITQKQYLDKKAALDKSAIDAELTAIRARRKLLEEDEAKETDPAKKLVQKAGLLALKTEIDAIEKRKVVIDVKLKIEEDAFKRSIESLRVDITANIMDLEGNPLGASMARLAKETEDLLNDRRVEHDVDLQKAVRRQAQLREERGVFDEQKRLAEERKAFLSLAEDQISFKIEQGQLSAIEGERAVRASRLETAAAILEQVTALEALAEANPDNKQMLLEAQQLRLEYEKLANTLDSLATSLNGELAAAGAGFVESIAKGEGALRSLGNALADVFGNLAKRFLKEFEEDLFRALQGGSGQGLGGFLASLFGGGGGGGGLGGIVSAIGGMVGYTAGVAPSSGGQYKVAGVESTGARATTKSVEDGVGFGSMYAVRDQIQSMRMPGYANGDRIGSSMQGAMQSMQNQLSPVIQNNNNLTASFTIAPDDIVRGLESNSSFERMVLKVVNNSR